nr:MAG TPA: hypothetical protein [Caudoviricetes sp.]
MRATPASGPVLRASSLVLCRVQGASCAVSHSEAL